MIQYFIANGSYDRPIICCRFGTYHNAQAKLIDPAVSGEHTQKLFPVGDIYIEIHR